MYIIVTNAHADLDYLIHVHTIYIYNVKTIPCFWCLRISYIRQYVMYKMTGIYWRLHLNEYYIFDASESSLKSSLVVISSRSLNFL